MYVPGRRHPRKLRPLPLLDVEQVRVVEAGDDAEAVRALAAAHHEAAWEERTVEGGR